MIFFLYIFCQIFPGGSPEPRGMYGVGWTKETTFHQLWHLCIRKSFYSEYLATYLKISLDFAFEQSKYVFTFRLDHSANEGTGFLWTIFHAQDTTNPSHAKKSLQNKFPPKLHLQLVLDGGFSDRRSYWSVFCRRRSFAEAAVGRLPDFTPILPDIFLVVATLVWILIASLNPLI